jgi:hypothetical protein
MNLFKKSKEAALNKKLLALNNEFLLSANKSLTVLKEQIAKGADIHVTDAEGRSLLDMTALEENIIFFLDQGMQFSNKKDLNDAVYHCASNPDSLSRIIALGGDVNHCWNNQFYPIHQAVSADSEKSLMILLAAHADINSKDKDGDTPLHQAIYNENADMVRVLLEQHPRLDIMNNDAMTPADLAHSCYQKIKKPCYRKMLELIGGKKPPKNIEPAATKEKISFVDEDAELNLRITRVFNFASRTCDIIVYNQKTHTQSNTLLVFEQLEGSTLLADAEEEFMKRGGTLKTPVKKRLNKS